MRKKRRSFSKEFKAKVALEALRERDTLAELAKKYELHPNQIISWKKHLQSEMASLFSRKGDQIERNYEEEMARLYEEIGRLKVERDWLKKSLTNLSLADRRAKVDKQDPDLSIRKQCELLSINRSLLYY